MNRKQRKIKRQRANQHRIASLKKLRQNTNRVRAHWLDEIDPNLRWMTDDEVRQAKREVVLMFAGAFLFIVVFAYFLEWLKGGLA